MPLGLAKDSMVNLAELAHQKEQQLYDANSTDSMSNLVEDEQNIAAQSATEEIEPLESLIRCENDDDDSSAIYYDAAQILKSGEGEHEPANGISEPTSPILGGLNSRKGEIPDIGSASSVDEVDSLRSDAATNLTKEAESKSNGQINPGSSGSTGSYGSYAGFANDYSEYEHYGDYNHYGTPPVLGYKQAQDQQPLWCCFFPWMERFKQIVDDESHPQAGTESTVKVTSKSLEPTSRMTSADEDEISTGSDVFGEKLSEKDRQAVLARLRLAQPDLTSTSMKSNARPATNDSSSNGAADSNKSNPSTKGLLNAIVSPQNGAQITTLKGILKRSTGLSRNNLNKMNQKSTAGSNTNDGASPVAQRRSLFPSYETTKAEKKNLKTEFSPMARVLTVKSHKDMDEDEKGCIWWQRRDYEEFRKTGRMITKAMLEGGSEIWLATNQSWLLPNKDRQSTLKHAFSLAERHSAFKKGDVKAKEEYEETRDKWWHRFGHSRRGLEHIASIDEGRQRQTNVRTAIRAVVEEQRRQKVFRREDHEKIRMVSIQHTSWARDLAIAAGASDADAVRMNFDDESRKSREFYLLKFSRSNKAAVSPTQNASVPAFMKPALTMKVQPSRLDVNTVSQIRYRQAQKKRSSVAPTTAEESSSETVPLKDDNQLRSSMAKKAAGFASGEDVGTMSAVLTGMGPIPVAGRS